MKSRPLLFTTGAFALFLAYFIFLYPSVVFGRQSFARRDILRYYYPMWKFGVDQMKSGSIPFWNPYHAFGAPFAANVQTCVFYPLQLILYLPDYTRAFNLYILVHLALAGAFTAAWLRDLGVSKTACLAGGLAYSMSGYMASAINLTISLCSAAYFPLVLLCFRRAIAERSFRWRAALAVTLLFQYLAGDPAIFFSTLVVLTVFAAFRTVERSARARRADTGPLQRYAASVFVFLGLAAFHYPLFYQFLRLSTRHALDYGMATSWSMQFNDLIAFFVPFFSDISMFFMDYWIRQSWLESYYAGITVLLLAGLAFFWKRDTMRGCHVLLALFGLSLALGRYSGVYWFFSKFFPFFGLIRYPIRFLYLFYFAAAGLAGFAVDSLVREEEPRLAPGRARFWAAGIFGMAALIWATMFYAYPLSLHAYVWTDRWLLSLKKGTWLVPLVMDMTYPVLQNVHRTAVLLLLGAAGVLAARARFVRGPVAALFLMVLIAADLGSSNVFEILVNRQYLTKTSSHIEILRKDPDLFRVYESPRMQNPRNMPHADNIPALQEALMQMLCPNLPILYGIADISGYDSLFLKDVIDLLDHRWPIRKPEDSRFYDWLNAKYFVSPRDDLGPPSVPLDRAKSFTLYRNSNVLPRAFLARRAEYEPDREKAMKRLAGKSFDPLETVILSEDPGPQKPDPAPGEGRVTIEAYRPEKISLLVESPGDRWLFLSDSFYPGWRAWVDGRPEKIWKANAAFRALRVGPGRHRVEWKYDPLLFKMGLGISLLTAAGLAAAVRRG